MAFIPCKYKNKWSLFDTVTGLYHLIGSKEKTFKRADELNKYQFEEFKNTYILNPCKI